MMHPDTKLFLEQLLHDDKNSNYFICHIEDGKLKSTRRRIAEIQPEDFNMEDCYFSINGFIGYRRTTSMCRQLNALYFDLDCHSVDDKFLRDWKIEHTLLLLTDAFESGQLPYPNMILHTGRGLAMYYILESSISLRLSDGTRNEKALFMHQKIRAFLQTKLSEVLWQSPDCLTLDKCVSDCTRIARVPGTINSKSRTLCRILSHNEDYYSFEDFCLPKPAPKAIEKKESKKKIENIPAKAWGLQFIRLQELVKLQQYRKGEGQQCREFMAFLYYNAATQIYAHEIAVAKLHEFNSYFKEPLADAELDSLVLCTDKNENQGHKGYYKIKKDWIIEKLHITGEEIKALNLFPVNGTSRLARALAKREAKAQRNAKILALVAEGVKRQDIADQLGITKATVQNVLRANGATRSYCKK